MPIRVDIAGGGIGGIALAAVLQELGGIGFRVFEQAPELKAVGYGLTLLENAIVRRWRTRWCLRMCCATWRSASWPERIQERRLAPILTVPGVEH